MFAYCNNNPIIKVDFEGEKQRYIIYDNTGGDNAFLAEYAYVLKEQYEENGDSVSIIPVTSIDDFCNRWKEIGDGEYDTLDILLHGAPGIISCGLTLSGNDNCIGHNTNYACQYDFDVLSDIVVNEGITLYACNGGTYYNGGSAAQCLANKGHARVKAISGSKGYIWNGLLQHCAGPFPLWGAWKTYEPNPTAYGCPMGGNRRMTK